MGEMWDIYDSNRNKTGRLAERENYKFQKGEFHLITVAVIMNPKKQILLAKRAENKKRAPLKWEDEAIFLKETKKNEENNSGAFKDFWLFKTDVKAEEITFPDQEATEAKWVTINELLEMSENDEIISGLDFI